MGGVVGASACSIGLRRMRSGQSVGRGWRSTEIGLMKISDFKLPVPKKYAITNSFYIFDYFRLQIYRVFVDFVISLFDGNKWWC